MLITENPQNQTCSEILDNQAKTRHLDNLLLQGIIESVFEGILILTEAGEWIYANDFTRQICANLTPNQNQPKSVPEVIWRVCRALIESRSIYPNQLVIMEDEVTIDYRTKLRIQVRWLQLNAMTTPCLLAILENQEEQVDRIKPRVSFFPRRALAKQFNRFRYKINGCRLNAVSGDEPKC
ncbi:hypothetical protein [Limnofasciculus baicalensis]|uniref:Uncharacterized protein n=1 Tax=Limnofasciculus baicalensis BBK-W-15 TaxID=2699891 RepID=A0AAE3KLB2_9CYAN|nr:hypothetical protein [Limnofasciculus baicalensis]MCP2727501.1 hypothetical protein [Limnofasciculus baicalensis BBK-W-15]